MLALLTALAEAVPVAQKLVDVARGREAKAATAARVAADPAAPAPVKEAAARVAADAIAARAEAEAAAVQAAATAGKAPAPAQRAGELSTSTLIVMGVGLYLLTRRR
jgi:hypothetical protein